MPPYFNCYHDVIDKEPHRVLRLHFIHQPMIKRAYAECTPLYQLIKLINMMKNDLIDSILNKISESNQLYVQLSYYIKKSFLNAFDQICWIENCFVCKLKNMTLYFTIYLTKIILFIKLRYILICVQYYYFYVRN